MDDIETIASLLGDGGSGMPMQVEASNSSGAPPATTVSKSVAGHTDSKTVEQEYYCIDEEEIKTLKSECPWMKDPKHFQTVALSPSAAVKISNHCQSGVDKGIAKGGNPIEVMGLLLGRPAPNGKLIVTDAFPLPVEGFETRVVANDESVVLHMVALGGMYVAFAEVEQFSNNLFHTKSFWKRLAKSASWVGTIPIPLSWENLGLHIVISRKQTYR